jgi:hypothetical protein
MLAGGSASATRDAVAGAADGLIVKRSATRIASTSQTAGTTITEATNSSPAERSARESAGLARGFASLVKLPDLERPWPDAAGGEGQLPSFIGSDGNDAALARGSFDALVAR